MHTDKYQRYLNNPPRFFSSCGMPDRCFNCKKASSSTCQRCKEATYCSRECQAAHWKEHKKVCRAIAEIKGLIAPSRDGTIEDAATIEAAAAATAVLGGEAFQRATLSGDAWSTSGLPAGLAVQQSALFEACSGGEVSKVKALLRKGARADPPEAFGIPLHAAARGGHAEIVEILASAGAAVDRPSRSGVTALELAVGSGTDGAAATVRALMQAGASPSAGTTGLLTCATGTGTLLHLAAACDDSDDGDVVTALLDLVRKGTSTTAADASAAATAVEAAVPAAVLDATDPAGCTPLMHAAAAAHVGAVTALLSAGASVSARGNDNDSALDLALDAAAAVSAEAEAAADTIVALVDSYAAVVSALVRAGAVLGHEAVIAAADAGVALPPPQQGSASGGSKEVLLTPLSVLAGSAALLPLLTAVLQDGSVSVTATLTGANTDGSRALHIAAANGNAKAAALLVAAEKKAQLDNSNDGVWLQQCVSAWQSAQAARAAEAATVAAELRAVLHLS